MFYNVRGVILEQVAERSCGCLISGSVQAPVRRGFEQPHLLKDVPAHGKEGGLDGL